MRFSLGSWCLAAALMLSGSTLGSDAGDQLTLVRSGLPHDALFDAQFLDGRGLAVGAHGAILESLDDGKSWNPLESLGELSLLAIAMAPGRSIIVGQQGAIFVAVGAEPYRRVDSGSVERLLSVALDEASGRAVAVGGFGTVLISNDAGETWDTAQLDWESLNDEGLEAHLYDVEITPRGEIFVVGEFGLVLSSVDGGATWQTRAQGDESLFALHLGADGIGYVVGQDGAVLRSQDSGHSWVRLDTGSRGNLLDVWASPEKEVVVVGIRTLLRSSDGGESWAAATQRSVERAWYQALAPGMVLQQADEVTLHQQRIYAVGQMGKIATINY
jgi:photosystem II stability/assembly factor-like uncharacterized protein